MSDVSADPKAELRERQRDYLRVRQQNYRGVFDNPLGRRVLVDLEGFCRARQSTFNPDPRVHALMEGRREVWLRIQEHLGLSEDDLWKMKGG